MKAVRRWIGYRGLAALDLLEAAEDALAAWKEDRKYRERMTELEKVQWAWMIFGVLAVYVPLMIWALECQ